MTKKGAGDQKQGKTTTDSTTDRLQSMVYKLTNITMYSKMPQQHPEVYKEVLKAMNEAKFISYHDYQLTQDLLFDITQYIKKVKATEETKAAAMKTFNDVTCPSFVKDFGALEGAQFDPECAKKFVALLKPIVEKKLASIK